MNEWQKARICWIPAAAGGRKQPPVGPRYSTVARFNEDLTEWSVVVEFDQQPKGPECVEGQIRFLTPDAPIHLLQPGRRCELVEGKRIVATVEILFAAKAQIPINGVPYKEAAIRASD
ncbi:MAG: hypothetical protein DYG89_33870 [Caldilinea sp. CFX5]|nr:hypothetical protein [Caldilinea sp. CFX5]